MNNKPTGVTGSYDGKQYEQIRDRRGNLRWRPRGGVFFISDDKILLALNKNATKKSQSSKQSNSKGKETADSDIEIKTDSSGNTQIIDKTIFAGIFGNDSKRTFTYRNGKWYKGNTELNAEGLKKYNNLLRIKKGAKKNSFFGIVGNELRADLNNAVSTYRNASKKSTVKVKRKPATKPAATKKPVATKPTTATKPTITAEQNPTTGQTVSATVEQPQITVQPQAVVQPQAQSEQFLGAPLRVLDEDMLNDSSVKDYDTLLDYMYNNPDSSFTQGFMNMVYSNMGSNLDYWDPNTENLWEYLRRNLKPIERIAGIRGRYGNGLFGTSGDYQDLIRSINGYAREANRGIMYNRPQQGYTPYNVYPGQLAPTGLVVQQPTVPIQTSNNMITINGENLELGQGWGVRDGQVYDETGRLRTWSPQELRFLRKGGSIPMYSGGGVGDFNPARKKGWAKNDVDSFFLNNYGGRDSNSSIKGMLQDFNKLLEALGQRKRIAEDDKWGDETKSAYEWLNNLELNDDMKNRLMDRDLGNLYDNYFNKGIKSPHSNAEGTLADLSLQTTLRIASSAPVSTPTTPTQLMTPNRLRTIQRDFFRNHNINDYDSFVNYMKSDTGSDLSKAFMNMAQINGWTEGMRTRGIFNWLRDKNNQKIVEKALGTRGKWGRGLFGFSGDLEDATNILNGYIDGINYKNNLRQQEINTGLTADDRMWGNISNVNPQPTQQSNPTIQPNNSTKLVQQFNPLIIEDRLKKSRLGSIGIV